MRTRVNRWLRSDLVGVAATVYTFGVLVLSLAVFRYASPVAGVIVAVGLWIPMFVFAVRERGYPPRPLDVAPAGDGPRHRVLVVANKGLEDPSLCEEVCRQMGRAGTEVMIFAPVFPSSRLHGLANDVDRELDEAERRLDAALETLHGAGVHAAGRADIAAPVESLLDGLREFPANEVVMLPSRAADWKAAHALAERVRSEVGLPVTEIGARA